VSLPLACSLGLEQSVCCDIARSVSYESARSQATNPFLTLLIPKSHLAYSKHAHQQGRKRELGHTVLSHKKATAVQARVLPCCECSSGLCPGLSSQHGAPQHCAGSACACNARCHQRRGAGQHAAGFAAYARCKPARHKRAHSVPAACCCFACVAGCRQRAGREAAMAQLMQQNECIQPRSRALGMWKGQEVFA